MMEEYVFNTEKSSHNIDESSLDTNIISENIEILQKIVAASYEYVANRNYCSEKVPPNMNFFMTLVGIFRRFTIIFTGNPLYIDGRSDILLYCYEDSPQIGDETAVNPDDLRIKLAIDGEEFFIFPSFIDLSNLMAIKHEGPVSYVAKSAIEDESENDDDREFDSRYHVLLLDNHDNEQLYKFDHCLAAEKKLDFDSCKFDIIPRWEMCSENIPFYLETIDGEKFAKFNFSENKEAQGNCIYEVNSQNYIKVMTRIANYTKVFAKNVKENY